MEFGGTNSRGVLQTLSKRREAATGGTEQCGAEPSISQVCSNDRRSRPNSIVNSEPALYNNKNKTKMAGSTQFHKTDVAACNQNQNADKSTKLNGKI